MNFLKRLLLFFLSNGLVVPVFLLVCSGDVYGECSSDVVCFSSYEEALLASRNNNKCLILFFNGSDWSSEGMKLKKEIFLNEVFLFRMSQNFVFCEVDFPCYKRQINVLAEQNRHLRTRFGIEGIPSIILLDSKEREMFRFSGPLAYDSPEDLSGMFLRVFEHHRLLSKVRENLGNFSIQELKKYYQLAKEIRSKEIGQIVLQKGVKLGDDFFLSEQFRLLLESGKMDTDECQELKRILLDSGRRALKENYFTIALLEFQELVERYKRGIQTEPESVLRPLKNYLSKFGESDDERKWRIEMMVAQFYLDSDFLSQALKHAELAFHSAPLEMKDRVFQSLSYIRDRL